MSIKSFGLILRAYANKPEYVPDRVREMDGIVQAALACRIDGQRVFTRVDIVVWTDPRFTDSDCGETADAMRRAFSPHIRVFVSECNDGDLFCGILNWAVAYQMDHGVSHSVIASYQARDHMDEANLHEMIRAVDNGALATGVALHELTGLILRGRLANTFAMWDNRALMDVDGFDLHAQKPVDEHTAIYLRGWSEQEGETRYSIGGVEEVIPLARLVAAHGPCIAPILPQDEAARYRVPDPQREPENYARHVKKMGTKECRQDAHLYFAGFDAAYLEGGVLPSYRHQD